MRGSYRSIQYGLLRHLQCAGRPDPGPGRGLLLNRQVVGQAVFRTLFYIPAITPAVASAILWLYILQPQYGLLNMGILLCRAVRVPTGWAAATG